MPEPDLFERTSRPRRDLDSFDGDIQCEKSIYSLSQRSRGTSSAPYQVVEMTNIIRCS